MLLYKNVTMTAIRVESFSSRPPIRAATPGAFSSFNGRNLVKLLLKKRSSCPCSVHWMSGCNRSTVAYPDNQPGPNRVKVALVSVPQNPDPPRDRTHSTIPNVAGKWSTGPTDGHRVDIENVAVSLSGPMLSSFVQCRMFGDRCSSIRVFKSFPNMTLYYGRWTIVLGNILAKT